MELSIIIVNYNTPKLTQNTINSVITTIANQVSYEIILVDNQSREDVQNSLKIFTDSITQNINIKLIINKDNLGFSKANNIGINESIGKNILLLNSDTIVQNNCIQLCLNYLNKQPQIGALGCKLLLEDGSLDHACKRGFPSPEASLYYFLKLHKLFPTSHRLGQYTLSYQNTSSINEVDSLTGAFMLLPRQVIDSVGLLDEDFFMYGEDIDWCYRIKEAGYKIIYYPKATTIHLKGKSSKKKKTKTTYEFHRAMILFYNKHYKSKYPFIVSIIMYIAIYLRLVVSLTINLFRR